MPADQFEVDQKDNLNGFEQFDSGALSELEDAESGEGSREFDSGITYNPIKGGSDSQNDAGPGRGKYSNQFDEAYGRPKSAVMRGVRSGLMGEGASEEDQKLSNVLNKEKASIREKLLEEKGKLAVGDGGRVNLKGRAKKRVKKVLIGAMISAFLAAGGGMLFAIPHAIQSWIEGRTSAYTQRITEKMGERLLTSFMRDRVALKSCRGASNSSNFINTALGGEACRQRMGQKEGFVKTLFDDWQSAGMEDILEKKGVAISFDPDSNPDQPFRFRIYSDVDGNRVDLADQNLSRQDLIDIHKSGNVDASDNFGRREFAQILKADVLKPALKEDLKAWQFIKRRNLKAGFLRSRGLPTRFFGSQSLARKLDLREARIASRHTRWRQFLTKHIVSVGEGRVGSLINILMTGNSSKIDSDFLKAEYSSMRAAAGKLSDADVLELIDNFGGKSLAEIREIILRNVIEKIVKQIAGEGAEDAAKLVAGKTASAATKAIPVVGWVLFAFAILDIVDMASDGTLQRYMSYQNAQSLLDISNFMDTTTSEERRGEVDLASAGEARFNLISGLGSSRIFANTVGYNSKNQGAVESYNCGPEFSTEDIGNLFEGVRQVAFDDVGSEELNQSTIGEDESVCSNHRVDFDPVESIGAEPFAVVQSLLAPYAEDCIAISSDPAGISGVSVIRDAVNAVCDYTVQDLYHNVDDIIGGVVNFLGLDKLFGLIFKIPLIQSGIEFIIARFTNFMTVFVTGSSLAGPELLAGFNSESKPGARLFDGWHGGQEVLQNTIAQGASDDSGGAGGFGGVVLSPTQAAELNSTIALERKEELAHASIFERFFDISQPDTIASGLMATTIIEGGASNLFNPMRNIASIFNSNVNKPVYAASPDQAYCSDSNSGNQAVTEFGVVCFGLPDSMIDNLTDEQIENAGTASCVAATIGDAENDYWNFDPASGDFGSRNTNYKPDGSAVSYEPDWCRTLCTVTDAMGTFARTDDPICGFETQVATADLGSVDAGAIDITSDYQQLADSILNSGRVSFDSASAREDLATGVGRCGDGSGGSKNVNIKTLRVMDFLLDSLPELKLRFGSIMTDHSCGTQHEQGQAFDIGNEEVADQVMPLLYNNREQLELYDLFFNPTRGLYGLDNGLKSSIFVEGHDNHIHVSVKP